MSFVRILETGRYTPQNIVNNYELSNIVDTSDEWITSRTGIKERRISTGEDATDLAIKAALNALKKGNIKAESLDLIIVATTSPDSLIPSIACKVQGNIGAIKAAAFDISAACSGFVYGLNLAQAFIKSSTYNRIMVIGTEVLSKVLDWTDRSTCVLFGDGAAAIILESSSSIEGLKYVNIGADGSKGEVLTCAALKFKNPFSKEVSNFNNFIAMNGKEVFKFAVKIIENSVIDILENNHMNIEQIDYIVCHQANYRIIETAAKKLKVPMDKFYVNLDRYGNTSSASIGIALDEMSESKILKKGDNIILVGFGGGLTWGGALIQWN